MDSSSAFIFLVEKYLTDSITPLEEQNLLAQLESEGNRELLRRMIDERAEDRSYADIENVPLREAGYEKLEAAIQAYEATPQPGAAPAAPAAPVIPIDPHRAPRHSVRRTAVAAATLLLLATGTFVLYIRHQHRRDVSLARTITPSVSPVAPLAPGGNKAILQLGNGSTIILDSAHNGLLARQGGARVIKLDSGELSYQGGAQAGGPKGSHADVSAAPLYNTITTPRGGQYQLVLPDGTRVWLNAASSLRFPTAFTGSDRTVSMTGEAYFEVASDKVRPFHVQVNQMTVDVLGTHFNVMAYSDEKAVKTTLLEGSVKVEEGSLERLLSPGQQASLSNPVPVGSTAPRKLAVQSVDVQQVVAWKNGFFELDNMDLGTIMRQISRWYDVDINYQTMDTTTRFGGGISRKLNLPDVLRLLEVNGVRFKLENRILTITP
jgi:ferric-dicitrate binding protein FerR (iron transport regulator)